MKTFTIAVVALAATVGPPAVHAQRAERPASERAAVRQHIEQLEAQYRQMIEALSSRRGDPALERQLQELRVALERTRSELRALEPGGQVRVAEELQAVERALQEQVRVHELQRADRHVIEERHAELERALDRDAERALRAVQEARVIEQRHRAQSIEEVEHALRAAQEVRVVEQRHRAQSVEEVERALRAAQEARVVEQRHQAQRTDELQHALRAAEEARVIERLHRAQIEELRGREPFESFDIESELDRLYGDGPRSSWAPQDPADSVWRAARDRMNRGDYQEAARLFARIHSQERYGQSTYRANALYWNAFALNRIGTRDAVRQSLELLERLTREFPETERHADTNGLLTTVQVRLAEMGNEIALEQVRATAVDEARAVSVNRMAEVADRVATVQALRSAEIAEAAALRSGTSAVVVPSLQSGNVVVQDGVILGSADNIATYVNWGLPAARLTSLSPQCARGEAEIQLIALNSLVRMDTAAAMPVLREVMTRRDECSAPLRQSAMTVVARVRSPEADRILSETARTDPDAGVRRAALVYLGSRNEDQAVGIAEEALRTADSAEDRQWALQALSRMRTDRAWAVVRDYAARTDVPAETRRSAVAILSGSNDSTNTAFLRGLYGRVGNDRELKEAILMSSAFRRGAADPEWMLTIARDASEEARIREFAVMALSRNETVGTPRFIALYDGSEDKRVKLAVVRVLADRAESESAAVDKLIAIARTEEDTDLRKTAVLGLPANDPRARELLLAILRGM